MTIRELIAEETTKAVLDERTKVAFLARITQALAKGLERSTPQMAGFVFTRKETVLVCYGFLIDALEAAGLNVEDDAEAIRFYGDIRLKANYEFTQVHIDHELETPLALDEDNRPDSTVWIVPLEHFSEIQKICEFLIYAINGIDASGYPHLLESVGLDPKEILKTEVHDLA